MSRLLMVSISSLTLASPLSRVCVRVYFFALVCLSSHTEDPYNMDQPVRQIDCELTFVERAAHANPTGDRGQLVQPLVLLPPVVPHPVPEQRLVGPPV